MTDRVGGRCRGCDISNCLRNLNSPFPISSLDSLHTHTHTHRERERDRERKTPDGPRRLVGNVTFSTSRET